MRRRCQLVIVAFICVALGPRAVGATPGTASSARSALETLREHRAYFTQVKRWVQDAPEAGAYGGHLRVGIPKLFGWRFGVHLLRVKEPERQRVRLGLEVTIGRSPGGGVLVSAGHQWIHGHAGQPGMDVIAPNGID